MQLQLGYRSEISDDDADKRTFDETVTPVELDTILSNVFNSGYLTQAPTLGLFMRGKKMFMRAAFMYQFAKLVSRQQFPEEAQIDRTFTSILPMAMMRYRFSEDANL